MLMPGISGFDDDSLGAVRPRPRVSPPAPAPSRRVGAAPAPAALGPRPGQAVARPLARTAPQSVIRAAVQRPGVARAAAPRIAAAMAARRPGVVRRASVSVVSPPAPPAPPQVPSAGQEYVETMIPPVGPPLPPVDEDEGFEPPEPGGRGFMARRARVAQMRQRAAARRAGGGVRTPPPPRLVPCANDPSRTYDPNASYLVDPCAPIGVPDTDPYTPGSGVVQPADPTQPGGPFDPNRYGSVGPGPYAGPVIPAAPNPYSYPPADDGGSMNLPEEGVPDYSPLPGSDVSLDIDMSPPDESGNVVPFPSTDGMGCSSCPGLGDTLSMPDLSTLARWVNPAAYVGMAAAALQQKFNEGVAIAKAKLAELRGLVKKYQDAKKTLAANIKVADWMADRLTKAGRGTDAGRVLALRRRMAAIKQSEPSIDARLVDLRGKVKAAKAQGAPVSDDGLGIVPVVAVALIFAVVAGVVAIVYYMGKHVKDVVLHGQELSALGKGLIGEKTYKEMHEKAREEEEKGGFGKTMDKAVTAGAWIAGLAVAGFLGIKLMETHQRRARR